MSEVMRRPPLFAAPREIASLSAAGGREDKNALLVVDEGGRLAEIGRRGPVLGRKTLALPNYASRPAGDAGRSRSWSVNSREVTAPEPRRKARS